MKTRGLPGMLAPTYQELQVDRSVMLAAPPTSPAQNASAVSTGSITVTPLARSASRHSAIQSTCCSIDGSMLVSTDGLPGPVMVNRLGKPTTVRPRYDFGPSPHFSLSVTPFRPRI